MQPPAAAQQVAQQVAEQSGFLGIRLEGWLTLLAVILGPIIALWLQRISERRREARTRKLWVFRELMATRAARLSSRHVEALNLIDLEFGQKSSTDKKVLDAWRLYLDSLGNMPGDQNLQPAYFQRRDELFVDLIYEMGRYLGFPFDKVTIQRNTYTPIAHGELEDDQKLIRKGVVELLTGKRGLSVLSWLMPPQTPYPVVVTEVPAAAPPRVDAAPPAQRQPLIAPGDANRDVVVPAAERHEAQDRDGGA